MSIILRLQGLDATASTQDIRKFFDHLHIPDGGVYVLGGHLKEAFIAFNTERDAQFAMRLTGHVLKGSKVTLHISNMAELEHKLTSLLKKRKRNKPSPKQRTGKRPQSSPDKSSPSLNAQLHDHKPGCLESPDPNASNLPLPNTATLETSPAQSVNISTAFLLGVCTVFQELQSSLKPQETPSSEEPKNTEQTPNSSLGYIRIFGLPVSATKDDICHFFRGLSVKEAIMNVELGPGNGCLVQFATMQDACDALDYNNQRLGSVCVEVRSATEKMWTSALQECKKEDHGERTKHNSGEETISHIQKPTCAFQPKRQAVNQLSFEVPKKPRPDKPSATLSPAMKHIVMVRNLSNKMTKTEIKELFGCPQIANKNVLHLLKNKNRTDTAFLIFNCTEDYDYAMNLDGYCLGSAVIEVSPVTERKMRDMLSYSQLNFLNQQNVGMRKNKDRRIKFAHQKREQIRCRRA
ncbi:RNA binding motif protein 12Ba isoform X2 [Betta splendens]|nr:RNA binding motif protein 12Ba isoform X2 [Betta splendens]